MRISERGLKLIKEFEGCLKPVKGRPGYFQPYICPAGVLTLGWGTTNLDGQKFTKDSVWSQEQCDRELMKNMARYEYAVEKLVKVKLNQNQFDALVSFAYNCGEGNLGKSTLLKRVNAGDFEGAARQFAAWNKGGGQVLKGLVRRRAAEAALFRAPVREFTPPPPDVEPVPRDPMPQQVDPPALDKPSFVERVWTWLTGGGIAGAAAFFTDWRVVALILLSMLIVGILGVWFMGPENVRDWIRRKVNR